MKTEARLSDSIAISDQGNAYARYLGLIVLHALLLFGCSSKQVVVEGNFPSPLIEPIPLTVGVIYPQAFAEHEFFDEAKGRTESDWLVKTGVAQVAFWDKIFVGMFDEVVHIQDWETVQSRGVDIDGVIIPAISDLQYTIPAHTNEKIYEIWMRYEFRLVDIRLIHQQESGALTLDPNIPPIAEWSLTAYGKTPTAFLRSDEEAVNLAAVVALRDGGANFISNFGPKNKIPDLEESMTKVAQWIDDATFETTPDTSTPYPGNTKDQPPALPPAEDASDQHESADDTLIKGTQALGKPTTITAEDLI